jgi:tetratricopeptide (TPR) repeat protein
VHVDDNALTAFVAGELPALEQSRIREHLDDCEDCRVVVRVAVERHTPSRADTLAAGSVAPQRTSQRHLFKEGDTVGPYVIERLVGVGGMGVVYAARDPRLDRLVALKLLRHLPGRSRAQIEERMRRESKALARLSHANVTVVYELGTAGEEIFVAMEYVAGTTLREWLSKATRTPAAILATFTQAGRGLAAAHAAGLVHRDFKPDNVLIGEDGVAKVTDFGLAQIAGEIGAPLDDTPTSLDLTATGSVVGTPAYMAPEQFTGTDLDARADQFAFCVTLFEALYRERPFRGETFEELRAAVLAGKLTVPRAARIPSRVRGALARGLAVAPGDRFATMDELLACLAPRRTAIVIGGAGGVLATAAVAAFVLSPHDDAPVCQGADIEVANVWNAERKAAMQRAFGADNAETFSAVTRALDTYFAGWTTMSGEACEATRVYKKQSEATLDLRTTCLGRQRAEVGALIDVLTRADAGVVAHATEAVANLPALSACIDVAARTQEPVNPALRARLDAARAQIAVSQYREVLPELVAITSDPAMAKLPALEAEAQQARAKVLNAQDALPEAEQALFRALVRAQAAHSDELIAKIAVDLAHLTGFRLQRPDDGLRWVDMATAAIATQNGNDLLAIRLASVRATILQRAGKMPEAEAAGREALAAARAKAAGTSLEGEVSNVLGMTLAVQGKFVDAIPILESALVLIERAYGKRHSITATVHVNLANALAAVKRDAEAIAHHTTALEINESLFGKDGVSVAAVLSNLGKMMQERKRPEARAYLERALAIREKALGPRDPAVARTAANLGYLLLDEKAYQDALDMFARVGTILDKKFGPDHPARADDLAGAGLAWIGLGKPASAIEPFTRAVALSEQGGGDPVNTASIRAGLAQALHASGKDKRGGAAMARAARAILLEAGETSAVADIDRWLR